MAKSMDAVEKLVREKLEPYVAALGKVAHSWNHLQDALAELFFIVTGLEQLVAEAIWHSMLNDRWQRELLRAAVTATTNRRLTEDLPKAKDDILWLLQKADDVGRKRDTAVHAPITVAITSPIAADFEDKVELIPDTFYGNRLARKLVGKDILAEFEWYELTADALTSFARGIKRAIETSGNPRPFPWPDRPRLPVLEQRGSRKQTRHKNENK